MRKIRGRPRYIKGRFIQGTKTLSELFGPTKAPPTNPANRYTSIIVEGERSTMKVTSVKWILHQEEAAQL